MTEIKIQFMDGIMNMENSKSTSKPFKHHSRWSQMENSMNSFKRKAINTLNFGPKKAKNGWRNKKLPYQCFGLKRKANYI